MNSKLLRSQLQAIHQRHNAAVSSFIFNTSVSVAIVAVKPGLWSIGDPGTHFVNSVVATTQDLHLWQLRSCSGSDSLLSWTSYRSRRRSTDAPSA